MIKLCVCSVTGYFTHESLVRYLLEELRRNHTTIMNRTSIIPYLIEEARKQGHDHPDFHAIEKSFKSISGGDWTVKDYSKRDWAKIHFVSHNPSITEEETKAGLIFITTWGSLKEDSKNG